MRHRHCGDGMCERRPAAGLCFHLFWTAPARSSLDAAAARLAAQGYAGARISATAARAGVEHRVTFGLNRLLALPSTSGRIRARSDDAHR
jgi:hypothetical protein